MNESFNNTIARYQSVLIFLPTKPFFDQIAAALALYLALEKRGKDVEISSPAEMLVEHSRLVGVDKITQTPKGRNLIVSFPGYDIKGFEKVSYDIVDDVLKLNIVSKAGSLPPRKEQMKLEYSGISEESAIVLIGGANESHFPALAEKKFEDASLLHIGTQELSLREGRKIFSFAAPASSVSEIVASFISNELDTDIASNLLMGIYQQSRSFSAKGVTAETFSVASELMRVGGRNREEEAVKKYPSGAVPGEKLSEEPPPRSWLEPKIYKGTSVG